MNEQKPEAVASNDQLGQAPAYLGNGHTAYAARVVASWPEHNRARFSILLFTGAQLEDAVAAERERLQAQIDALMLEHCPGEMTHEQMAEWAKRQVAAPGFDEAALDAALKA